MWSFAQFNLVFYPFIADRDEFQFQLDSCVYLCVWITRSERKIVADRHGTQYRRKEHFSNARLSVCKDFKMSPSVLCLPSWRSNFLIECSKKLGNAQNKSTYISLICVRVGCSETRQRQLEALTSQQERPNEAISATNKRARLCSPAWLIASQW